MLLKQMILQMFFRRPAFPFPTRKQSRWPFKPLPRFLKLFNTWDLLQCRSDFYFMSFNLLEGTPKIPGPTLHFSFTHLALCHDHTLFLQLRTNPRENSNVSSIRDHNHINGYKIPCHHLLSPVSPVVTQSDEPLLPMRKPGRSLLLWDPG